jgi:3-hydroxymyristoyl/3-hydroxydecanoyl-(acyl carrier protein) dehydratase/1-acyl-sn-glycerol-3-phosphate acyltransferase
MHLVSEPVADGAGANVTPELMTNALPGPKFSRAQLEQLASRPISAIFGPAFERQDRYARQVRMPEPPLLLANRVTGIDALPGSMSTGTIWTETDVGDEAWYLHAGRMPAGVMIESGQADLLLVSWLGADWHNRGERVYRLLGCDVTWHGPLPQPGETLVHEIRVDGHAQHGDVRLFFFHSECRIDGELRMTIRNGQAGFFTDAELAASRGVVWDAATTACRSEHPVEPPVVAHDRGSFDADAVGAFAEGDLRRCFGPGFVRAATHVRTPTIQAGSMQLIERVDHYEPRGGPWRRGYLKASLPISAQSWFFAGHFKNDPCMPGTLMFEGGLQAMAFYLAAHGFTLKRDGWRFEPVAGERVEMRCRGQVTPQSRELVYEIFVQDLVLNDGVPTLYADLLCSVDGLKAFHARRVGLKLVPDWPLEEWGRNPFLASQPTGTPVPLPKLAGLRGAPVRRAALVQGFLFDYESLLASAWGSPSRAFGPLYDGLSATRRIPRVPAPPFMFISRVSRVDGELGVLRPGSSVEVEYDLPDEAWYFEQNASRTMPFTVLKEIAVQPPAWLGYFMGVGLCSEEDLLVRNLGGTATVTAELTAGAGTIRTRAKCLGVSQAGGMVLLNFAIEGVLLPKGTGSEDPTGERPVFRVETSFGAFPEAAFDSQPGLPVSPEQRQRFDEPGDVLIDLTRSGRSVDHELLRLPGPMLRMIDRVDACQPTGGKRGLGYLRARKDVDPGSWIFKAHFFQDPVQPGSLGLEAICQLLQFHMIRSGMAGGLRRPRFESLQLGRPITWKYRGQVVPSVSVVTVEIEVIEQGRDDSGVFAVADAWLWADERRIYHVTNVGVRIVEAEVDSELVHHDDVQTTIDLTTAPWLRDHRPNYTVPTLPLACSLDRMAAAALKCFPGRTVIGLRDVHAKRWIIVDEKPTRLKTEVKRLSDSTAEVVLMVWRDAATPALSRFEPAASAIVMLADTYRDAPARLPALPGLREAENPYRAKRVFHGPAFQRIREFQLSESGCRAIYDAAPGQIPSAVLAPALLDASLQAIPTAHLFEWCSEVRPGEVGYPSRLSRVDFFAAPPDSGDVACTVVFAGRTADRELAFDIELLTGSLVWARLHVIYRTYPFGAVGAADPAAREAFMERRYVPGLGLSHQNGQLTCLSDADLQQFEWLPGTVSRVYRTTLRGEAATREVAVKEHLARRLEVHPSEILCDLHDERGFGVLTNQPQIRFPVQATRAGMEVRVVDAGKPTLDVTAMRQRFEERLGTGQFPMSDMAAAFLQRFVRHVTFEDPAGLAALKGRSVLFLANHQTAAESFPLSLIGGALTGHPVMVLTRAEYRHHWVGVFQDFILGYPGVKHPSLALFFNRDDHGSLPGIIDSARERMAQGASLLVHVEGACALSAGQPVQKVSSIFSDLALTADVPIVPVRLTGALPVEPIAAESQFPVGFAAQDYHFGRAIEPDELRRLPYAERRRAILAAINRLGPPMEEETLNPADPDFAEGVDRLINDCGIERERAIFIEAMSRVNDPCAQTVLLNAARLSGRLVTEGDERGQWLARFGRWLLPNLSIELR